MPAALYLARAKYRVLVLEKLQFGGQISITNEVVNYPGIERTGGQALTDTMQKQAESFGAEFVLAEAAVFDLAGDIKTVHTNRGDYRCFGICWPPVPIPERSDSREKRNSRAGYAPDTEMLKGTVEPNEQGYIVTDAAQKTSIDGVYAAGDVCIKPLRQVVTATSDGALAATGLEKYVAAMQRKTGLRAGVSSPKQRAATVTVNTQEADKSSGLFTAEMRQQLDAVFARMENSLLLKLYLDDRSVSKELEQFITALAALSDKLRFPLRNIMHPATMLHVLPSAKPTEQKRV